jgi:hypothetical protein
MARNKVLSSNDSGSNDEQFPPDDQDTQNGNEPGDAKEPDETAGDLDFDPAKLDAGAPDIPLIRDPYDPAFLGLSQDFAAEASVVKKWDIIKVEKPSKSRVFRTHPTMRIKTMLLVLKEDNEIYLVAPELRQALADEPLCGYYTLFPCITKAGTPFIWHVRMRGRDGKWNIWHESAFTIAEKAVERWCRMQANQDAGYYVAEYDKKPPEQQRVPDWPDLKFRDWLELGFRGFTIDSLDHPVLKRLRMED